MKLWESRGKDLSSGMYMGKPLVAEFYENRFPVEHAINNVVAILITEIVVDYTGNRRVNSGRLEAVGRANDHIVCGL